MTIKHIYTVVTDLLDDNNKYISFNIVSESITDAASDLRHIKYKDKSISKRIIAIQQKEDVIDDIYLSDNDIYSMMFKESCK